MIGPIQLFRQTDKPWTIRDNDIQSKSIQAWAERGIRTSSLYEKSVASDSYKDSLFEMYVASQKVKTFTFYKMLDLVA